MMQHSFWSSIQIDNFLFYGYDITSLSAFICTCFAAAALAFMFEWIKFLQTKQRQKEIFARAKQIKTICPSMEGTSLLSKHRYMVQPVDLSRKSRYCNYTCDAALWISLHNLGYIIMLIVMVFNVWIFCSIIIGGAIGYFVFGQGLMKLNIENCQVIKEAYCMANCSKPGSICNGESTPVMVASTSSVGCHQNTSATIHNESETGSDDDK